MKISKTILNNAQSLLTTSLSLFALGKKHHAAHFAALSLEECTKCLMYIDGVKELFKGKDRNHFKKEELMGFFYFLAGRLSAGYTMKYIFDAGIMRDTATVNEHIISKLLVSSGMKGEEGLIGCIDSYIKSASQLKRSKYINNEIRKNSVYIDVENGVLMTPMKRVNDKAIKDIINDAKFAVSLMNMALDKNFSWLEFLETYPKIHPNPKKEAKKMLTSLRKSIRSKE